MMWLQFGTDGYLYASARLTPGIRSTRAIVRYDANTGAVLRSSSIGRDGWAFTVGPNNVRLLLSSQQVPASFMIASAPPHWRCSTVSLNAASVVPVTVNYSTANGTALAGSDYVPPPAP